MTRYLIISIHLFVIFSSCATIKTKPVEIKQGTPIYFTININESGLLNLKNLTATHSNDLLFCIYQIKDKYYFKKLIQKFNKRDHLFTYQNLDVKEEKQCILNRSRVYSVYKIMENLKTASNIKDLSLFVKISSVKDVKHIVMVAKYEKYDGEENQSKYIKTLPVYMPTCLNQTSSELYLETSCPLKYSVKFGPYSIEKFIKE